MVLIQRLILVSLILLCSHQPDVALETHKHLECERVNTSGLGPSSSTAMLQPIDVVIGFHPNFKDLIFLLVLSHGEDS